MQRSLFLFILMGQCFFITSQLYEYHHIERAKSWDKAQKYCRDKYTDLATVSDMTDIETLSKLKLTKDDAWIGLNSNPGEKNRKWHWSLPGVKFNGSEQSDLENDWNCGSMDQNGQQWTTKCSETYRFICYDEKKTDNKILHFSGTPETWTKAQDYCRDKYTDLISGDDQIREYKKLNDPWATISTPERFWIGLFRDTWSWSDESSSSFRHWNLGLLKDGVEKKECATVLKSDGKWDSADCIERKPFVCYDDKVILVQKNKTWEEALYYCREEYDDLVTITDARQQRWVQDKAKNATTSHVWLGVRYTCTLEFWFWISDQLVTYKNWAKGEESDGCDMSGAMVKGGDYEWFKKQDEEEFNFICSKV